MIDAQVEVNKDRITIKIEGKKFKLFNEGDSLNGYYFAILSEKLEELKELSKNEKTTNN